MTTIEPTLDTLREVIEQLDALDEKRAALIVERDEMIRVLRHTTSAPRIGKVTGLSTTGIYKIDKRETL